MDGDKIRSNSLNGLPNELKELIFEFLVSDLKASCTTQDPEKNPLADIYALLRVNKAFYWNFQQKLYKLSALLTPRLFSDYTENVFNSRLSALGWAIKHDNDVLMERIKLFTPELCTLGNVYLALQSDAEHVATIMLQSEQATDMLKRENARLTQQLSTSNPGFWPIAIHEHPFFPAMLRGYSHIAMLALQGAPTDFCDWFSTDERAMTPLLYACRAGDLDVVRFLLNAGAYPEHPFHIRYPNSLVVTPFMTAVINNRVPIIEEFVERFPEVLRSTDNLCVAIREGNKRVFDQCIQAGAGVNPPNPFNDVSPLKEAIAMNNAAFLRTLLAKGATVQLDMETEPRRLFPNFRCGIFPPTSSPFTHVSWATTRSSPLEIVELLLSNGATIDQDEFYHYITQRVAADDIPLTRVLLEHGAPLIAPNTEGSHSIIDYVISLEMLDMISEYADIKDMLVKLKWTPVLECLIRVKSNYGTSQKRRDVFARLVGYMDNVDCEIKNCRLLATVCTTAASPGHATPEPPVLRELVRTLLEKGADPNFRNRRGETMLHYVAMSQDSVLTKSLLHFGANVQAVDDQGNTSLHACLKTKHEATALQKNVTFSVDCVRTLLAEGADPKAMNKCGVVALHLPHTCNSVDMQHLLELGADPMSKDMLGRRLLPSLTNSTGDEDETSRQAQALLTACPELINLPERKFGRLPTILPTFGLLPMYGMFPTVAGFPEDVDSLMTSPLMNSVKGGRVAMTTLLLKHGAGVNARYGSGQTALDIAYDLPRLYRNKDRQIIIKRLKEYGAKRGIEMEAITYEP